MLVLVPLFLETESQDWIYYRVRNFRQKYTQKCHTR